MSRLRRRRPSPALVVAVMALVAALAGTAVAADPVANTAVGKKKTNKIAKKQAKQQINKTPPIGAEELGEIQEVSRTFQVNASRPSTRR